MIKRELRSVIDSWLFKNKVLIIYGARQVGKTTLAKQILNDHESKDAYYSCEIPSVRESLASKEPSILKRYFGHHKIMVLDEAQFVPEIGQILKIFSDHLPDILSNDLKPTSTGVQIVMHRLTAIRMNGAAHIDLNGGDEYFISRRDVVQ